mmetsp:Transcript_10350/g.29515  ORF Transcript_10350/g.29515 Transcript_10350/m.29515 type:complete len:116 (-) Transcript_10350:583-930(-)
MMEHEWDLPAHADSLASWRQAVMTSFTLLDGMPHHAMAISTHELDFPATIGHHTTSTQQSISTSISSPSTTLNNRSNQASKQHEDPFSRLFCSRRNRYHHRFIQQRGRCCYCCCY